MSSIKSIRDLTLVSRLSSLEKELRDLKLRQVMGKDARKIIETSTNIQNEVSVVGSAGGNMDVPVVYYKFIPNNERPTIGQLVFHVTDSSGRVVGDNEFRIGLQDLNADLQGRVDNRYLVNLYNLKAGETFNYKAYFYSPSDGVLQFSRSYIS